MNNIDILDNYKTEELLNYFSRILGLKEYEENPRDREIKNSMITAKLAVKDLLDEKFLTVPPENVKKEVPMGSIVRTSHRMVEAVKDISYKNTILTVYKTISYSTVEGSEEKYDYMVFLDMVKKT